MCQYTWDVILKLLWYSFYIDFLMSPGKKVPMVNIILCAMSGYGYISANLLNPNTRLHLYRLNCVYCTLRTQSQDFFSLEFLSVISSVLVTQAVFRCSSPSPDWIYSAYRVGWSSSGGSRHTSVCPLVANLSVSWACLPHV